MEITNPRRILAVSLAECQDHLTSVIRDLTGAYPEPSPGTGALAGTTQELALRTAYYTARVPVWLDLVGLDKEKMDDEGEEEDDDKKEPEGKRTDASAPAAADASAASSAASSATPKQWADAFLAEEAREVRSVLGGVVVVLDLGGSDGGRQRDLVGQVGRLVRKGLGGNGASPAEASAAADDDSEDYYDSWDGVGLVVAIASRGTGQAPSEDVLADWEDACVAAGLEFVLVAPGQAVMNEFGEKTGIPRVLEALEANDWSLGDNGLLGGKDSDDDDDDDDDDDEGSLDFGAFQRPSRSAAERADGPGEGEEEDIDFYPESLEFGHDRSDFVGLREAIWRQSTTETADEEGGRGGRRGEEERGEGGEGGEGEEDDVQAVERMMQKLLAARELGSGLPPDQRRRLAARAVGEVMREL